MNSTFKGTFLLTVTMTISKVLGLIYIIPFTLLVGTSGYILYEYAYKPYAIMLSLATMGIPSAVSKFVAKYNEMGNFAASRKLLKAGIVVMLITGVFWFASMQFAADTIADLLLGGSDGSGSSKEDVIFVIRTVSYALLIVPVMALLRGYFQGNQKMAPTGISQVIEQLVRIAFILTAAFLIMKKGLLDGDLITAIGYSVFAATVGAFVSFVLLIWYFYKYREMFREQKLAIKGNEGKFESISLMNIFKEIIWSAIPFVIISLAIPVYQNIDISTINRGLVNAGNSLKDAEYVNSVIAIANKLVNMTIVLANAFALTLVPAITKAFVGKDKETLKALIQKTLQVIIFVNLPFAAAFFVLSGESYATVFGTRDMLVGGQMIQAYSIISLFFCLFVVTSAILQGISKEYFAVGSFLSGLLVKFIVAVQFVEWFGGAGSSYSTMLGFSISILINLIVIFKSMSLNPAIFVLPVLKVVQYAVFALIAMLGAEWLIKTTEVFETSTYLGNLFTLLTVGLVGAIVYIVPSYLTGDLKKMISK